MKKLLLSLLLLTPATTFGMRHTTFNLSQACEQESHNILTSQIKQQLIDELVILKNCSYSIQSLQDAVVQKNIYLLARKYLIARCIPITTSHIQKQRLTAYDIINHEHYDLWKISWHGALKEIASEILDALDVAQMTIGIQNTKLEDRMDEVKDDF